MDTDETEAILDRYDLMLKEKDKAENRITSGTKKHYDYDLCEGWEETPSYNRFQLLLVLQEGDFWTAKELCAAAGVDYDAGRIALRLLVKEGLVTKSGKNYEYALPF
jgi:Fic family protein